MAADLCNGCHVAPRLPGRGSTWCRACKNAWQREYRAGVRKQVRVAPPVRNDDGCLIWQGKPDVEGYGRVWGNRYAHREAFLAAGGVLDPEETVDHLCEVKLCVEPTHLLSLIHI